MKLHPVGSAIIAPGRLLRLLLTWPSACKPGKEQGECERWHPQASITLPSIRPRSPPALDSSVGAASCRIIQADVTILVFTYWRRPIGADTWIRSGRLHDTEWQSYPLPPTRVSSFKAVMATLGVLPERLTSPFHGSAQPSMDAPLAFGLK